MKLKGVLLVQPGNDDQPFVFLPMDGTQSEFLTAAQIPDDVKEQIADMGDKLELTALGVIVDMEGA